MNARDGLDPGMRFQVKGERRTRSPTGSRRPEEMERVRGDEEESGEGDGGWSSVAFLSRITNCCARRV